VPFSRGVNFSGWFQDTSFTPYQFSEQDFKNLKLLGADVVRLPLHLRTVSGGPPWYTLDPLFLEELERAVAWAEQNELYIILDNHFLGTPEEAEAMLLPVLTQLAKRFKDHSSYVLYEILNEPSGIEPDLWGEIQGKAIETIRGIDSTHTIVVGGVNNNSIKALYYLPFYKDKNLIYTFHFYSPFLFTHQGASWTSPPLTELGGVPFPAEPGRMPALPPELLGTYVEGLANYYSVEAALGSLEEELDQAELFSRTRGVPVFCGEFGAAMLSSAPEDRVRWYETAARLLDERHIARISWDYFGYFGLFNAPTDVNFKTELNVGIVRALGFTPPGTKFSSPQHE
jgi:endoglucanase